MKDLEDKIREALPHLKEVEKGQIFHSKYYENITATKIIEYGKGVYSIYGFCEEGLPRDNYYPKDLELVGKPIMLNDVLLWLKGIDTDLHSINKYGIMHDKEWNMMCRWNLNSPYLSEQSEELIKFLNGL